MLKLLGHMIKKCALSLLIWLTAILKLVKKSVIHPVVLIES